jgi:hypothetical protein
VSGPSTAAIPAPPGCIQIVHAEKKIMGVVKNDLIFPQRGVPKSRNSRAEAMLLFTVQTYFATNWF